MYIQVSAFIVGPSSSCKIYKCDSAYILKD